MGVFTDLHIFPIATTIALAFWCQIFSWFFDEKVAIKFLQVVILREVPRLGRMLLLVIW